MSIRMGLVINSIDKAANHIDKGGVDFAKNIVRVRGEIDHLNCHLLMLKPIKLQLVFFCIHPLRVLSNQNSANVSQKLFLLSGGCY